MAVLEVVYGGTTWRGGSWGAGAGGGQRRAGGLRQQRDLQTTQVNTSTGTNEYFIYHSCHRWANLNLHPLPQTHTDTDLQL